jgi:hypothetical protein
MYDEEKVDKVLSILKVNGFKGSYSENKGFKVVRRAELDSSCYIVYYNEMGFLIETANSVYFPNQLYELVDCLQEKGRIVSELNAILGRN